MGHYKYLIIGGGMTADAAALGIREVDTSRSIGLIARNPTHPTICTADHRRAGSLSR